MKIWPELRAIFHRPLLVGKDADEFNAQFRERCYRIAILVSVIGAIDATALSALAYYGYGPAYAAKDAGINLLINWASPLVLFALRDQSRKWYPWIICASITISNGQYLFHVFQSLVLQDHFTLSALKTAIHGSAALTTSSHPQESQETFLQLQLRAVLITFWITALVPLPFVFAATWAIAFFTIYGAMMWLTGASHDVVYALVRIGFIVFLGVTVAATVERRERRLFLANRDANEQLAKNAERMAQYEDAQRAALKQISLLEQEIQSRVQFMSDAFHDIKGPIGGFSIGLDAYQQARQKDRDEMATAALANMIKQCKAANKLAAELFDLSIYEQRQEVPKIDPVNIAGLLEEVVATFSPTALAKNIDLRMFISGKHRLNGLTNESALRRIVMNLVANAIKFTPPPSPATKTPACGRLAGKIVRRKSGVIVGAVAIGGSVQIQIRDTGVGISKTRLSEIWGYGHTTLGTDREKGSGIGLAMVRAICAVLPQHSLRLNSTEGKGSLFSITMPSSEETVSASKDTRPNEQPSRDGTLSGITVLLVENDAATLEGESILLRMLGAKTLEADSVGSAIAMSQQENRRPDVILTDFYLDNGETGANLIAALRSRWDFTIPAIVATADCSSEPLEATRVMDRVVVLRKTINETAILSAVGRLCPSALPQPAAPSASTPCA